MLAESKEALSAKDKKGKGAKYARTLVIILSQPDTHAQRQGDYAPTQV
jgi:hypothetical protein